MVKVGKYDYQKSTKPDKKLMVTVKGKTIHFGDVQVAGVSCTIDSTFYTTGSHFYSIILEPICTVHQNPG